LPLSIAVSTEILAIQKLEVIIVIPFFISAYLFQDKQEIVEERCLEHK